MKFITIAALALLSQVSAIRFDESEGPTKADLSEDDNKVVGRADDSSDPKDKKWQKENPLSWTDGGEDDPVVLTMLDGSLRMAHKKTHKKRHHRSSFGSVLTMVDGSMRPIYDEDGDGVEDNVKKTRDELDRFYEPAVFGVAEEIHNTHHGNLPGHVRKAEYEGEPDDIHIHF